MRALLCFVLATSLASGAIFSCGGTDSAVVPDGGGTMDATIGSDGSCVGPNCIPNDSGGGNDSGGDSASDSGRPDSGSSDSGGGNDSSVVDSGITDGGKDVSVLLDAGPCVPEGGVNFQCGQLLCKNNQTEYCFNMNPFACDPIPPQCCGVNRTCMCVLANIKNPCDGGAPKCVSNQTALYVSCN